jgi:hypothetical protein
VSFGKRWTKSDIEILPPELRRELESAKTPKHADLVKLGKAVAALNVQQITPTKKPLLNKTETAWKAELERRGHKAIYAQSISLRLGDDCRYLPDLVTITPALDGAFSMTCYETKAPHAFRKAGIVKIKAAARQYPFIRFVLVMRDKGNWTEKEIGNE